MLVALLVTSKVAFAAADAAGPLKLQQRGVPKVSKTIRRKSFPLSKIFSRKIDLEPPLGLETPFGSIFGS